MERKEPKFLVRWLMGSGASHPLAKHREYRRILGYG